MLTIVKRLVTVIPTLIGVVIVTFLLTRVLPGDPAVYFAGPAATPQSIAEIRKTLGLDRPLPDQFAHYVNDLAHGNFGNSLSTGRPVATEITSRLPASAELTLLGLFLAIVIAVPLGIFAAVKQGSLIDHLCRIVATAGVSLPVFFTGLLLVYIFYFKLGWSLAPIGRMTRASMLAVLSSEFIRTARASGLDDRTVILTYGFRNAMLPVVTTLGMVFSFLLGANVLVEKVFAWPGIGSFAVEALIASDFAPVQGFVLTMAVMYVMLNLAIDILYGVIDPRVRVEA